MDLLGIHLTLMIGPTVAVPVPPVLVDALEQVVVAHKDKGRSGFQITFQAGRSGPVDLMDYALFRLPQLKTYNRVVLVVTFNAMPHVLMDGIITNQQLSPSNEPGATTLTITGEDVSVMMDREEKSVEHPAQSEAVIATKLIATYAKYELIPQVISPPTTDQPMPTERIPVQQGTDLAYLELLAKRHGYVFYIKPGKIPMTNTAYWGPPVRLGVPQKALTMNMGADTNLNSIQFRYNSLSSTKVEGRVQDRSTNQQMAVRTFSSMRPPLAAYPVLLVNFANSRTRQFRESGLDATQAMARAQGTTEASTEEVVTATGELDALRYGDLLWSRGLVGLRGCGYQHDGHYYVKEVTHSLKRGEYKQKFTITREGLGSLTPVVRV